jgi:hypothetical protein
MLAYKHPSPAVGSDVESLVTSGTIRLNLEGRLPLLVDDH